MLNIIRNIVKSIFGKILLLIMVASFAVWGMGDLLRSGESGLVAKVGSQKITINDFYSQFQNKLAQFNSTLDKKITEQEAHEQQITYLVLNEMVYSKLIQEFAKKNDIYLSDTLIKKIITSIPQFQDSNGNFNKVLYENSLLSSFNDEFELVGEISNVFLNQLVFENFSIPKPLNEKVIDIFYNYEAETRDVVYFNLDKNIDINIDASDGNIRSFYNDHIDNYQVNREIRFDFIKISQNDFMGQVKINEVDISDYYNENLFNYVEAETRSIEIINVKDIELANKILPLLKNNSDKLKKILDENNLVKSELDNVSFNDFDEQLSSVIFDLNEGVAAKPITVDGLGVFIVTVNKINKSKTITIDEAKDNIIKLLEIENSYQTYIANIDLIDELNLTGIDIEEIATELNIKLQEGIISNFRDQLNEENLRMLSSAEVGYQSDLIIDNNDVGLLIKIIDITDAYIEPLENIKEKVLRDLKAKKVNTYLSDLITSLELKYKYIDMATFEAYAKKNNLKLSEVKNLKRNESDLFKQETLDSIFKLSNESSLGFRDLNNNYGLVFINRINPSDNLIHGNDKQKLILNVQASFNQSMENIIKKKLSDDIEYELYIKNINNLFL